MEKDHLFSQYKIVSLFLIMVFFLGCTRYLAPTQYPLKPQMMPEFSGSGAVTLLNGYPSRRDLLIGMSHTGDTWKGDMQKWTSTAVALLKSELEKRGFNITQGAPKKLKLTIIRANLYFGTFVARCIVHIIAETSLGYTKEYEGDNRSGSTLDRACGGAVTKAVAAILNDEKILAYLNVPGHGKPDK